MSATTLLMTPDDDDKRAAPRPEHLPQASGERRSDLTALSQVLGGILSGLGLGWLCDAWLGSAPWGLVGGGLLGLVAGFYPLVKGRR